MLCCAAHARPCTCTTGGVSCVRAKQAGPPVAPAPAPALPPTYEADGEVPALVYEPVHGRAQPRIAPSERQPQPPVPLRQQPLERCRAVDGRGGGGVLDVRAVNALGSCCCARPCWLVAAAPLAQGGLGAAGVRPKQQHQDGQSHQPAAVAEVRPPKPPPCRHPRCRWLPRARQRGAGVGARLDVARGPCQRWGPCRGTSTRIRGPRGGNGHVGPCRRQMRVAATRSLRGFGPKRCARLDSTRHLCYSPSSSPSRGGVRDGSEASTQLNPRHHSRNHAACAWVLSMGIRHDCVRGRGTTQGWHTGCAHLSKVRLRPAAQVLGTLTSILTGCVCTGRAAVGTVRLPCTVVRHRDRPASPLHATHTTYLPDARR